MNSETTTGFPCPKPACKDKEPFKSQQALNMHTMRVHTLAGRKGAMWAANRSNQTKTKDQRKEEQLAQARKYNQSWRQRNKEKGLTAAGTFPKVPTDRKAYIRNWNKNNRAASKRILIAYGNTHPSMGPTGRIKQVMQPTEQETTPMNYCPGCGYDLRPFLAILRELDKQKE